MTWLWAIVAIVVGTAVLGAVRHLRLFFWAFFLSAGVLLALHMQASPQEGGTGLAALGAGLALRSRARRLMGGFLL